MNKKTQAQEVEQLAKQITIPWEKLDNLERHNAQVLIYMASGMKPREAAAMYNAMHPVEDDADKITGPQCSTIKMRYKDSYNLMRGQVLEHIQLQQVNSAFQMALERVNQSLEKYECAGTQGSITETLYAVNQLKKLRAELNAELIANQPKAVSDNKSEVLALLSTESAQAAIEEQATIPTSSEADYEETTSNQDNPAQDAAQDAAQQDATPNPAQDDAAQDQQSTQDTPQPQPDTGDAPATKPDEPEPQPEHNPFHA